MGQRTDTRERIIVSALQEMREKGYASTTISDIVEASGAPRGSVTFHFPGGKDEIAREVVDLRAGQVRAGVDKADASSGSARDFLATCFDRVADDFAASGYLAGCPVAPVAIDRAAQSPELCDVSSRFFREWQSAISEQLVKRGVADARAQSVASLAVCAIEGALVVGRTEHSSDALLAARDQLSALLDE